MTSEGDVFYQHYFLFEILLILLPILLWFYLNFVQICIVWTKKLSKIVKDGLVIWIINIVIIIIIISGDCNFQETPV